MKRLAFALALLAALPALAEQNSAPYPFTTTGPSASLLKYPSGTGLVCIGINACLNATTASRIIAIGRNACATVETGHDDICIGDNADVPSKDSSNMIVIGGQPPLQISELSERDFIDMQIGITRALSNLSTGTK